MSITVTITSLPTAPSRDDADNFSDRMDDFLAVLEDTPTEINSWATQANLLAVTVNADAVAAATAANIAVGTVEATIWLVGTTYGAGDYVQDPGDDYKFYVSQQAANTGHTPNTDDGTWWELVVIAVDAFLSADPAPTLAADFDGDGYSMINTPLKQHAIGAAPVDKDLDVSAYNDFAIEPTADIEIDLINLATGAGGVVQLLGAGDHTIDWKADGLSNVIWDNGVEPSWATGTNTSIMTFYSPDGVEVWGRMSFAVVA